jgi:predicted nucleic acid-binding protein
VIVVDTNILASLLLDTEQTAQAEAALRRDPHWAAPLLWRSELRNVIVTQMRRGHFDLEHSLGILEKAEVVVGSDQYEVPDLAALSLAERSGCSAYDCEFVALAHQLGLPLVTLDQQILKAFPGVAVNLEAFAG